MYCRLRWDQFVDVHSLIDSTRMINPSQSNSERFSDEYMEDFYSVRKSVDKCFNAIIVMFTVMTVDYSHTYVINIILLN